MFSKFLDRLAQRFTLNAHSQEAVSQLKLQAETKHIVFVLRRPSYIKTAVLRRVCRMNDLPDPKFTIEDELPVHKGKQRASRMYLRSRRGQEVTLQQTRRQRRKLKALFATARRTEVLSNSIFVPVSLLAGRGPKPVPAPTSWNIDFPYLPLGDLWLLIVYRVHREALEINIGPILELPPKSSVHKVFALFSRELYWKEKLARGARPHSSETIESIVLSGKEFEATLDRLAIATSSSPKVVQERAQQILREMAATINHRTVAALRGVLNFVFRRVFNGVEVHGLDQLRSYSLKHPIILLPSHKSHFDYLLMSWILYHANMPIPHVAAGNNLNFFPVGRIIRCAGAFFIRRKIENDYLYKTVLERYLTYLIKHGHLIQFFIEGGRSRSGFILPPRLGLLKTLIRSFKRGDRKDIMLVPIAISYEQVVEATSLSSEQLGKKKRQESVFELLKARLIFKRRYGEVVVDIGAPISLKEFAAQPRTKSSRARDSMGLLAEDLGFTIVRSIAEHSAITATATIAAAIMSCKEHRASSSQLAKRTLSILALIAAGKCQEKVSTQNLRTLLSPSGENWTFCGIAISTALVNALKNPDTRRGIDTLVSPLEQAGLLAVEHDNEETLFAVNNDKAMQLSMYRNNLMHFLAAPTFLLLSRVQTNCCADKALNSLHQLFKPMLLLPHWHSWELELEPLVSHLIKIGWIDKSSGKATTEGRKACMPGASLFLHYFEAIEAAISLAQSLESSWVADAEFRENLKNNLLATKEASGESPSESDIDFAVRYLLSQKILQVESVSTGKRSRRCLKLGAHAAWNPQELKIDFSHEIASEVRLLCWCSREIRAQLDDAS